MAQITTEWDYDLKEEVFKVTSDKGYVHKTFTTLSTTSTANNTSLMNYFVATLKVNVDQDIGDSYIVIYDNGEPIPFTISNVEYTQYDWTENTSAKTITIKLGYITEHKIEARYLGNQDGLPSKSVPIILQEDMPSLFKTTLTKTDTTTQYDENTTITIPLQFKSGKNAEETLDKPIKIYVDDILETTLNISLTSGTKTATGTASLTGIDGGKHKIKCEFEGDDYNESKSLAFNILVGYNIELYAYPKSTTYVVYEENEPHTLDDYNKVTVRLLDWNGTPQSNKTVTRYNDGSSITAQTNSQGEVSFVCDTGVTDFYCTYSGSSTSQLTLPCVIPQQVETTTQYDHVVEDTDNSLVTELTGYEWLDNGAEEVEEGTASLDGIPVVITDSEGNTTIVELNDSGIATTNITAPSMDIPPVDIEDIEEPIEQTPVKVEYTATVGNMGTVQEVEQVWQFLSVTGGEVKKRYEILGGAGTVMKLAKGYKFKSTKDPKANQYACRVGFGTGATEIGDYQIIFKNLDSVKNVICKIGGWRNRNGNVTYNRPTYTDKMYFAPNSTYILSRVGNHMNITREGVGTVMTSQITTVGEPMLELIFENEGEGVILNNIKIREL